MDRTEWHRIVTFQDGLVEMLEKHAKKGRLVYVSGKLQTRLSGCTDPSHANCVAPGKRMRCGGPAIAIREGELVMPFGTPGSDVIPQAMAQALINIFVFGMDPQLAVEAPRFATYSTPALYYPHDYVPGELKIEETLARSVGEDLGKRGHKVEIWPDRIWRAASVCAIIRDTKTGLLAGGADNRRDAYAIGW